MRYPDPVMATHPYFLWDTPVTEAELRQRLLDPDPDIRAQWQGVIMREARFDDVWSYLTVTDVVRDWHRIRRHLGQSRAFWEFLLEGWRARGHLSRQ